MPRTRNREGFVSTLPLWIITDKGIQCPRKDCGGKAIVNLKKWRNSRPDSIGRSCTYCFRTNRIPE